MRIWVEIDINIPLKKGRKINVGGTSTSVDFKYERLHIFCYVCGKLGHTEQFCEILFNLLDGIVACNWNADIKVVDRRVGYQEGDHWLREDGASEGE